MSQNPQSEAEREAIYATNQRLAGIFLPLPSRLRDEARARQSVNGEPPTALKFAHYTSAEAAIAILRSREVWMRNTTCMADYREVMHGFDMLQRFFVEDNVKSLEAAFNDCHPGAAGRGLEFFNQWWRANLSGQIFVGSISEHSGNEDLHGRLSMWRAFGNSPTRVAIVLKVPWKTSATDKLKVMFSPVVYAPEAEVFGSLRQVAENIRREAEFLKTVSADQVQLWFFAMIFVYMSCLKHEGFHEEREWRAIYSPIFQSALLRRSTEVVNGIPQLVYHLPLDERVDAEVSDLDLVKMLDRIIIGPTQYPWAVSNSFVETLGEIGVENPIEKVFISHIPIRSYGT